MDNAELTKELLTFVENDLISRPGQRIDEGTPLVSSGLVDSFALVTVLSKLEELTRTRIPASKVRPADLDTVRDMLATARRLGSPR